MTDFEPEADLDLTPPPVGAQYHPAETEDVLLQLRAIIDAARPVPLSASSMIAKDEVLDLHRRGARPAARGAARRPLAVEGARGVPGPHPSRGRRDRRAGPRPGGTDGAAHRGRQGGRAARPTPSPRPPKPMRAGCVTRSRTSATRSWPASRSSSSAPRSSSPPDARSSRAPTSSPRPQRRRPMAWPGRRPATPRPPTMVVPVPSPTATRTATTTSSTTTRKVRSRPAWSPSRTTTPCPPHRPGHPRPSVTPPPRSSTRTTNDPDGSARRGIDP